MTPTLKIRALPSLVLTALAVFASPIQAWAKTDLWVYTSIYKEFAAPLEKAFEDKNPDVDVQIFQGGSEKIQSKVEAEATAKRLQVDLLLTSDPFWSEDLVTRGLVDSRPSHPPVETNYYSL